MKALLIGLMIGTLTVGSGWAKEEKPPLPDYLKSPKPADFKFSEHPRLLWKKGEEKTLKAQFAKNAEWNRLHSLLIKECDRLVDEPVCERKMIGKRLLGVSREALRRLTLLSYAYRMTCDKKYLNTADQELRAVCAFSDWNPSHFLDVAEMCLGVAVAYDWLYSDLTPETKSIVENALLEKGLKPGDTGTKTWWATTTNNWNQVCHGGLIAASLALYDKEPELAQKLITRAVAMLPKAMGVYAPDGVYNEGVDYWEYGTTYNVIALDLLEKAFQHDFGLSQLPGFLKTGTYSQQLVTNNLKKYNYSDNGGGQASFNSSVFWFYQKTKDPSLLYLQSEILKRDPQVIEKRFPRDRMAAFAMIWGAGAGTNLSKSQVPKNLAWTGKGENPIAIFRSSWTDPNGIYLGVKLGKADISHGHMDVGSFFLESDGVTWAMDLGSENYNTLEVNKVQLWGRDRWTINRYHNKTHNVLTINDKLHNPKGFAQMDAVSLEPNKMMVTSNISDLYEEVSSVTRSVGLMDKSWVCVQDKIEATEFPISATWSMVTAAETISFPKENEALLESKGKKLYLYVHSDLPVKMSVKEPKPEREIENQNVGTQLLTLHFDVPAGKIETFRVFLSPGKPLNLKSLKMP